MNLVLVVIIPTALILFIAGIALHYAPPKKINGWYGYRTPRSMKSQANWDYANRLAGKLLMLWTAIFYFGSMLLAWWLESSYDDYIIVLLAMALLLLCLSLMISLVEYKLNRFDQQST